MIRCRKCHIAQCICGAEDWEYYQTGGEAKAENTSLRTQVEQLRQRVQELEFALAETEALEMSHGERIEKLTAERDELLAALEKLTDVFANIGITSGLYDDEQDALKAACDAIASVKEMK